MRFSDFEKLGNLYLPKVWNQAGHILMHRRKAFRTLVNGVVFDGTNDYMALGAGLTGLADGKEFTTSYWILFNGGDAAEQSIFEAPGSADGILEINRSAGNVLRVKGADAALTSIQRITTSSTVTADATWHHLLMSYNAATTTQHCYLDGSSDMLQITNLDATIDQDGAEAVIGVQADFATAKLNASIAELWIDNTYVDLSVEANRLKFRSAAGKPVELGATGELAGNGQPLVYCRVRPGDAATVFATNLGSGGTPFAITGALTIAPTSP